MLTAVLDRDYSENPMNLENYFLMALYWSLGASLLREDRDKFDRYMRRTACFVEAPEGKYPTLG